MKCRELFAVCLVYLAFFYRYPPPLLFSIGIKFSPGYTHLSFISRGDSKIALVN